MAASPARIAATAARAPFITKPASLPTVTKRNPRSNARRAQARRAVRQAESKPLVAALKAWFEAQLGRVSGRSVIAAAFRYGLNHWDGLERYLDDGRIEMDTNAVERAMRPIALNRKNALFAGHDEGAANWACLASLIETCKLNGVDPQAYLADVLTKLVNLWPAARIDELLPWAIPSPVAAPSPPA